MSDAATLVKVPDVADEGASRKRRLWPLLLLVPVAAVAGALAWHHMSGRVSTDDAQIDGHVNPVAARVSGTVIAVEVADNQVVAAGAVLVRIDARELEVAMARARADLAQAKADAEAARAELGVTGSAAPGGASALESEVAAARARLGAATARQKQAEADAGKKARDAERLKPLAAKEEVARQILDAAVADAEAARAAVESAKADVVEAQGSIEAAKARLQAAATVPQQLDVARAHADSADAKVAQLDAALQRAQLDLDYAVVRAPVAGTVSRRNAEVGMVVQAGQPLLAIVPLEGVWVTANFKESQLARMRPGQKAIVKVDAYGGRQYQGHVESISAATGARFSLLPPENATGNFVKVVQRVPVKIVLEQGQDSEHLLRPGMSVVPIVLLR